MISKKQLAQLKAAGRVTVTERPRRPSGPSGRREALERRVVTLPATWHFPMPPSLNKLWSNATDRTTGKPIRVLTAEARDYKRAILAQVGSAAVPDGALVLRMIVRLQAFTKAGAIRKVDVSNRIKFLEDCLCKALDYDDSRHWSVQVFKRNTIGNPGVTVTLDRYTGQL